MGRMMYLCKSVYKGMNEEISRLIQKKFIKLSRKVGQTIYRFSMLESDDKILVALSGGKDSYILLETLADRIKHLPFNVELLAAHVHLNEVGYETDTQFMQELCDRLGVPLYLPVANLDLTRDPKKGPCFLCSWHRRKMLFDLTKELRCTKLALGHHLDDAVQTLLMNQIWHGSISSLPFKLKMFEGRIQLIRPLLELNEEELIEYAALRNYPEQIKICPYDEDTKRGEIRQLIAGIKKMNPRAMKNLFRSTSHICFEYVPDYNQPSYFDFFCQHTCKSE